MNGSALLGSLLQGNLLVLNENSIDIDHKVVTIPGVDFKEVEFDSDLIMRSKCELFADGCFGSKHIIASQNPDFSTSGNPVLFICFGSI